MPMSKAHNSAAHELRAPTLDADHAIKFSETQKILLK